MNRLVPIALLVFLLAGCSSSPSNEPYVSQATGGPVSGTIYVDAVKENYGDCLASLKLTGEPVFTAGGTGSQQAGTVTDGGLVWNVGKSNAGNIITLPANADTIDLLATVDC